MIGIDSLSKSHGSLRVLHDVSLAGAEGGVTALVGASGSGKTTLLRCLNGLETFDTGGLTVAGHRLEPGPHPPATLERLRRDVGMVFQQFNLFPHLSVIDNVTLAPPTNGRNVSLASDLSINVGNISVVGGNNDVDQMEPSGNGGLVTITDCVGLLVNSASGTGGGGLGAPGINMIAGDVTLAGSNFGDITATGGNGNDWMGGSGGDVETTNSTTGNINCSGGETIWSQGSGGSAGEVTVSNSTTGNITCSGGYGSNVGGDAGDVAITNSACGSISTIGGCTDYDAFKKGGNITLTNSTTGDLNSSAAQCGARGAIISAYVDAGGVFLGGTLTLVGGTILPNNIRVGRIIATNWSRGRGVNGSSILGVI